MSDAATLELSGIQAGYGDFQALFGIALRVEPGEAVGVVGPNGAGKTTLLRVISGLLRPRAGSLRYGAHDLTQIPAHRLPEIGIAHVPENRRLFPHLTVEENLKMGAFTPSARAHFAARRDRVFELFPRMAQRRHQLAGTMSGGEQQRLAIARAWALEPEVLFLDEPSSQLDPGATRQIEDVIAALAAEGMTILMTTHDLGQARRLSRRILFLNRGRLAEDSPSETFFAAPASSEARAFIAGDLLW
jgi:branched-chain amino acid transport system ATP-binding protein